MTDQESMLQVQSKVIQAVESLWARVLRIGGYYARVAAFYDIHSKGELTKLFAAERDPRLLSLEKFRSVRHLEDVYDAVFDESDRLFVGPDVWHVFTVIRVVHVRLGELLRKSLDEKNYNEWRNDDLILAQLRSALSADIVNSAYDSQTYGFGHIAIELQREFLKKATSVMLDPTSINFQDDESLTNESRSPSDEPLRAARIGFHQDRRSEAG